MNFFILGGFFSGGFSSAEVTRHPPPRVGAPKKTSSFFIYFLLLSMFVLSGPNLGGVFVWEGYFLCVSGLDIFDSKNPFSSEADGDLLPSDLSPKRPRPLTRYIHVTAREQHPWNGVWGSSRGCDETEISEAKRIFIE